jgi:hypothetical protein
LDKELRRKLMTGITILKRVWFSIFAANDEDVSIDKVVILDMTDGQKKERVTSYSRNIKSIEKTPTIKPP